MEPFKKIEKLIFPNFDKIFFKNVFMTRKLLAH